MKFESMTIALLVGIAMITAFTGVYSELALNYGTTMPKNMSENLTTVKYMNEITSNSSAAFYYLTNQLNTTSSSSSGNANPFWVFLSFAWDGLKFMLFIPVMTTLFVADMVGAFTGLGVPGMSIPIWFISLISAVVWVIFVFMIIRFLKGDTTNI